MNASPRRGRTRKVGSPAHRASAGGGSFASFLHRNRIQEAAAAVFAQRGIRQVTVEDLLVASSVSRRTFYRFFKNKDDVLSTLHAASSQYFLERIRKGIDAAPDPATKIEAFVDAYLGMSRTDATLMHMLRVEAQLPDSPLAPARVRHIEAISNLLANALEPGPRPDPLLLYGLLMGVESVSMVLHMRGPMTAGRIARAHRVMLRMMLSALAPKGAKVPPLPTVAVRGANEQATDK